MQVAFLLSAAALALLTAPDAHAAILQVAPDSPAWMHIGAATLLWAHIGGGVAGIATGAIALASRKGGKIHRAVGKVFFGVMLICYIVATAVAPFLDEGQRTNTIAGLMALYLLLSGWAAAQRPEITAGVWQVVGLIAAVTIGGAGAVFMQMGASDPTGTIDGSPPQAFVIFMVAGLFAAAGEINVLARRTLSGPARVSRHLWRMCFSLFIASGSFFLGQMQMLPDWMISSQAYLVLALFPVVAMLLWLVLVRLPRRRKLAQQ